MPSTSSSGRQLCVYYGVGGLSRLVDYPRVVLQPGNYAGGQLRELAARGTETLAYLSLSEDAGPSAPWQRTERNQHWGGHHVDVAHPGWQRHILEWAERALEDGFAGLFLDTLDLPTRFTGDREPLATLVARLRGVAGARYLMANRGFELLQELTPQVDGFLFEAFSTTWQHGYRALLPGELLQNVELLHVLRATGRELFALDYAVSLGLARFARARAHTHGLTTHVSNQELTQLD